jgi:putative SOS response-associated peptidase YedK
VTEPAYSYRPDSTRERIAALANPLVGGVHDRMPVMLMSEDYDRWLGPTTGIDDLKAMLFDGSLRGQPRGQQRQERHRRVH